MFRLFFRPTRIAKVAKSTIVSFPVKISTIRASFGRNEKFHQINCLPTIPVNSFEKGVKILSLYAGVLSFLGLKENEQEDSELIFTIKLGIVNIQREKYDVAEKLLHDALKLAHAEQNEDGITYVYDVLANLAFDRGQIEKAEKLFISVMQRLVTNGVSYDDNSVIHISMKLAKIYEYKNDHEKADIGYKYCIQNLEEKIANLDETEESDKNTKDLWISALDNYARFLVSQSRYNEALEYFKKALDMSVIVNGNRHETTALLLNDIGSTYNFLGDIDSAVMHVQEAISIGKGLEEMEHLPYIYVNLGKLYLIKEMYHESRMACQTALKKAKADYSDECISSATECLKEIEDVVKSMRK